MTAPEGRKTSLMGRLGLSGGEDDKGLGTHLNELLGLIVAYAKQETVLPLKNLLRFLLWGFLGAILIAVGGALLTLTAVRAVQGETGNHLHGHLTWVPYMAGVLVAVVGAAWAATRIFKGTR